MIAENVVIVKKVFKAQQNDFSCFFVFFQFLINFFWKVRQPSFGISPSLKVIERQTKKMVFEVNHALSGNELRSKFERMKQLHFLPVTPSNYRFVAYLLLSLFPCNRITLEVRMQNSTLRVIITR